MKIIERIETITLDCGTQISRVILTPEAREALTVRSKRKSMPLPVARIVTRRDGMLARLWRFMVDKLALGCYH